jgi:NAD(P)-dependent dehydrogenase (short-subunit alcohol dehydrogenase family)
LSDRRVAVVTGGARGIGAATCAAFYEDGLSVAVLDRDGAAALEAAAEVDPGGQRARGFTADVADTAAVDAAVAAVMDSFGRIDVLVNNAGFARPGATQDVSDADWHELVDVHLGGAFRCSRATFPHLRETGGAIVNISSVAATGGFSKRASYCAAKSGLLGLTRCLAVEWAPYGIRVNAVAPGHTYTQLIEHVVESGNLPPERYAARIGRIPMGRMATPAEIAAGVVFLGSPKASYISGETLCIDGAFSVNADELPLTAE